jgi:hypothetical protein
LNERKGDFYGYVAEVASGEKHRIFATAAHEAYEV